MIRKTLIILSIVLVDVTLLNAEALKNQLPGGHIKAPNHVIGNDEVPHVYSFKTSFKEYLIVRLKHGTDILAGLVEAVKQHDLKNAVILSGIGSTYKYHVHSVANSTFPSKNDFYHVNDPMDIVSVSGYVIEGKVHAHIGLSNGKHSVGGHLEPGTEVFTFSVITIGILEDEVSLERLDDKTWR